MNLLYLEIRALIVIRRPNLFEAFFSNLIGQIQKYFILIMIPFFSICPPPNFHRLIENSFNWVVRYLSLRSSFHQVSELKYNNNTIAQHFALKKCHKLFSNFTTGLYLNAHPPVILFLYLRTQSRFIFLDQMANDIKLYTLKFIRSFLDSILYICWNNKRQLF